MPAKITCTLGLPASGKSTWAKEMVAADDTGKTKRVNKDDLRNMLDGGVYSKDNEFNIIKVRNRIIKVAIASGQHLIVDDTNLNPQNIRDIRKLAGNEATVEIKSFMHVPMEECVRRNEIRLDPANPEVGVPRGVIEGMWRQWEEKWQHQSNEVDIQDADHVEWINGLPSAIIVDLDGTIALNNHGRSYYDFTTVHHDDVDYVLTEMLALYGEHFDCKVIVVSGRDDSCMDLTAEWLAKHDIKYEAMFMRATGDPRNDALVKREIFDNHIRGKYNISFVLDDRDQVVVMWREMLGLKVLQVAPGDF